SRCAARRRRAGRSSGLPTYCMTLAKSSTSPRSRRRIQALRCRRLPRPPTRNPYRLKLPPTALESIAALISPLIHPLTTTGIIAIFAVFILLQREDLRNRLIKLAGSHDLQKPTAALDDAATRLSRLFLMQLAVNASFGFVIGVGLWVIAFPVPS